MKYSRLVVVTIAMLAVQAGPAFAERNSRSVPLSQYAKYSTTNFTVMALDAKVAKQVGIAAERFRREKSIEWLGNEIAPWDQRCPIIVDVTGDGAGGATRFDFDSRAAKFTIINMTVEGPLNRIIDSVLPHEITHTIFATKFKRALPRWADEGGAVLSEDFQELSRHDRLVRHYINSGRMMPLFRLFVLEQYPEDANELMCLYAQGFSLSNYLVSLKGKVAFLDFVWDGQERGWEVAIHQYYGFKNYRDLERKWIQWIIDGIGTGADGTLVDAGRQYPTIPGTHLKSNVSESLANRPRTADENSRQPPQRPTASGVGSAVVYAEAPYATNGEPKSTRVMQATRDAFNKQGTGSRGIRPIETNQPREYGRTADPRTTPAAWNLNPTPRVERVQEIDDSQIMGTTKIAVRDPQRPGNERLGSETVSTRTYESPQQVEKPAQAADANSYRRPANATVGRTRLSAQPARYSDE